MKKLYHGTPTPSVPVIMREGLRAYIQDEPIHLTSSIEHAEGISLTCHDADDVTVLEVDVTDLTLETGYDGDDTFTCLTDIKPQRLRVMTPQECGW